MSDVFQKLDWSILWNALISIVPALFCITIHELSHGYIAYRLGDMTAKKMGRLTLNPIKHIDVVGLLMMALAGFGWAKPVPVDMRNFKHPKWGMALTALAGPLSNIILAFIMTFIYGLVYFALGGPFATGISEIIQKILDRMITLTIALAIFNLLPIPPLDGSKILFSLLPKAAYYKLMKYERFGMILLMALILSSNFTQFNLFGETVGKATSVTIDWFEANVFRPALRLVN